jgi:hypothetical protein
LRGRSGLASCVFGWLLLPGKVGKELRQLRHHLDLPLRDISLSHAVVNSTTTFDSFKMMLKPFRIRCLYDSSPGVVQLTTVQYDCEFLQPFCFRASEPLADSHEAFEVVSNFSQQLSDRNQKQPCRTSTTMTAKLSWSAHR